MPFAFAADDSGGIVQLVVIVVIMVGAAVEAWLRKRAARKRQQEEEARESVRNRARERKSESAPSEAPYEVELRKLAEEFGAEEVEEQSPAPVETVPPPPPPPPRPVVEKPEFRLIEEPKQVAAPAAPLPVAAAPFHAAPPRSPGLSIEARLDLLRRGRPLDANQRAFVFAELFGQLRYARLMSLGYRGLIHRP